MVYAQHCSPSSCHSVLLCPPLPSFFPNSNLLRRPHEALRSIRSFGLKRIDRSDQSAVCHLQISQLAAFALLITICPCVFYSWTPSTPSSETKIVGRVLPERLNAAVHSQSPRRSILCRLFGMSRRIFCTCEFPPANFHKQQGPQTAQMGQKCRIRCTVLHAYTPHSRQAEFGVQRTTMNQGGYNI